MEPNHDAKKAEGFGDRAGGDLPEVRVRNQFLRPDNSTSATDY